MDRADVVVVGMGPGGEDVAGSLAQAGLDVVGIEKLLVGGECPYWGCVPSKMMIRAGNALAEARRVGVLAGTADVHPDWSVVAKRIRDEATDLWNDKVAVDRFEGKGGRFVRGEAVFTGRHTVVVDGREFQAERALVVATGTAAAAPPIPGLDATPHWTNRTAIEVEELPGSLVVLGGGAIGAELAQVFARFGVTVTVVEALERLLPFDEPEAGALVAEVFAREGISVIVGAAVERVGYDGNFTLHVGSGERLEAERLLVATGRRANLGSLGVDRLGLDPTARWVPTDGRMRAGDRLWAVGDVTGKGAFTHVAMYQAAIATRDILGQPTHEASYHAVPRVTFTDPEVGAVGMTERQAIERGLSVRVGVSQVPQSARGWIHKAGNEGFVKLVEDARAGILVGATAAGPHGGEVLSMLTLAVHTRVKIDDLKTMIYAYPTFHRGVEDALRALQGAAVQP